ncbi:hypothetical protein Patl1_35380 [Pistacia atlantica]|nr:hypothetical protein Patl1_35380 [Pistacia atlantica]
MGSCWYGITVIKCFSCTYCIKKFHNVSKGKKPLDELVQDKCLCYTEDGKIGLGVRYCLDLRSWFRNLDVASCKVCNEAILKVVLNCFVAALLSRSD